MSETAASTATLERARAVAASVVDPELPMLTLADLGVLREVDVTDGAVTVSITPTYSGCPAMATMRDDLVRSLRDNGFDRVQVRIALHPAWTTDWITPEGKAALAAAGISPPGAAPRHDGPIALALTPDPPVGALPALRVTPGGTHLRIRVHRLQGDVPVQYVPGTVRPRQGDLR